MAFGCKRVPWVEKWQRVTHPPGDVAAAGGARVAHLHAYVAPLAEELREYEDRANSFPGGPST